MNYECDIILDLLPMYKDGALSEASKNAVTEHLSQCASCREKYERLNEEKNEAEPIEIKNTVKARSYGKKVFKLLLKIVVASVLIVCLAIGSYLSYYRFHTPNVFATAYAVVKVNMSSDAAVQVSSNPKVIVLSKVYPAQDYLESQGYTFVDQFGANFIYEKDGVREYIGIQGSSFFVTLTWF